MPYCVKCGVEVDEQIANCPLCHTEIPHIHEGSSVPETAYPQEARSTVEAEKAEQTIDHSRLALTWLIITLVLGIPFFVILTVSFQIKDMKLWMGYPLTALLTVWLIISIRFFFSRYKAAMTVGMFSAIGLMLYLFDLFDGNGNWFMPLGLPILGLFGVLGGLVLTVCMKVKAKGLNIAGYILLGSALFTFGLDSIISNYILNHFEPSWSWIAISAQIPVALIFFCAHFLFKKRDDYKKFFHI